MRGLHHVGHVALVGLGVEVLELAAAELLVAAQVEVGAAVDAFELLEADGELELDVAGGVGVVRQLDVVVEAVVLRGHAQCTVPVHALLLPGRCTIPSRYRACTKNCISICSNSRMRKMNCRATISLRKALPICAMPKGIFIRALFCTLRKLTKMPWAVSGRR